MIFLFIIAFAMAFTLALALALALTIVLYDTKKPDTEKNDVLYEELVSLFKYAIQQEKDRIDKIDKALHTIKVEKS